MINYIVQFIGVNGANTNIQFIVGAMFTIWLIYLFMQLIYNILGINK